MEKVVIQTFLGDADSVSGLFKTLTILVIELAPLLNLLNNFANFPFFGPPRAFTRGLILALNHRFNLVISSSGPNFECHALFDVGDLLLELLLLLFLALLIICFLNMV